MNIKVNSASPNNAGVVRMRCPACHQLGAFEPLGQDLLISPLNIFAGQRRCPDPSCCEHVFVVVQSGKIQVSYPAERIDFDAANIPPAVLKSFEEAITCHANQCFTASAIMVRKTLEELCNERGATGKNLKERITALGSKVVLPTELLKGLDDLRLLGNDAAHIESEQYGQIGQEEIEVSIEFAKEVLKAVYQYSTLLSRLQALKKKATP